MFLTALKPLLQKNEYSGTGIGLAICEKIALKHHGYIHASSVLGRRVYFYNLLTKWQIKEVT